MGTGFLEVNIQPYRGWEGWAAPRRLHVWCVCLRVRLFPVPSSSTSQKAAAQVAAHPAFAVREVVRVPGSVVSHRSLRRRGEGGFQKWGPCFCVRTDVATKGAGTQILARKIFSRKKFPPHMCSQNDQRNVGIILSHVCWGRTPPPPRHGR